MSSEVMNDTGYDRRDADEMPLHELWREDYETHGRSVISPGFWAIAVHRIAARKPRSPKIAQKPLAAVHRVLSTTVDWVWGIRVPEHTHVGRRVHIWHFGSLLLNARSIGNDVHIRHDTTFGPLRAGADAQLEMLPVIQDKVEIGSGACVLGSVEIGRGARVGANTVVLESVASGATVFGVPSRVIPT